MFNKLLSTYPGFDLKKMRYDGLLDTLNKSFRKKTQLVNKKNGWEYKKFCPVCSIVEGKFFKNSDNELIAKKYGTEFYKCKNCSVVYANRIPKNIMDVYGDLNYLKQAKQSYLSNVEYRKTRFGIERINLIKQNLDSRKNIKLLDIGCGTGWFLELAKENFSSVYGLEPAKELAKNTEKRLNIKIFKNDMIKEDFKMKFDVITMFDVIEHIPNPVECIEKSYDLLNNKGILIIFTPNNDSYAMNYLNAKSCILCPPDHLNIFNNKSLRKVSKYAGFKIKQYSTNGSDIADIYMQLKQEDKKNQVADFLNKNSDKLQSMIDKSQSANHMRLILKKN